jgi:hypothetical protein
MEHQCILSHTISVLTLLYAAPLGPSLTSDMNQFIDFALQIHQTYPRTRETISWRIL